MIQRKRNCRWMSCEVLPSPLNVPFKCDNKLMPVKCQCASDCCRRLWTITVNRLIWVKSTEDKKKMEGQPPVQLPPDMEIHYKRRRISSSETSNNQTGDWPKKRLDVTLIPHPPPPPPRPVSFLFVAFLSNKLHFIVNSCVMGTSICAFCCLCNLHSSRNNLRRYPFLFSSWLPVCPSVTASCIVV